MRAKPRPSSVFAKAVFTAFLAGGFVAGKGGGVAGLSGFKQVEDNAGEFMGGGGDSLGGARSSPHAPEVVAEVGVALACAQIPTAAPALAHTFTRPPQPLVTKAHPTQTNPR
jgi:hypothetical protein